MNEKARKKGSSGEHPAVKNFRAKLDSIEACQIPELAVLNERIERLKNRSDVPPPVEEEPDPEADEKPEKA